MRAMWNDATIAEAPQGDLIYIEGNWYFPPATVNRTYLKPSGTHTTCPWKGEASYYTLTVEGQDNPDAAWYYHEPKPGAIDTVKRDFTDYVAFWRGVTVQE